MVMSEIGGMSKQVKGRRMVVGSRRRAATCTLTLPSDRMTDLHRPLCDFPYEWAPSIVSPWTSVDGKKRSLDAFPSSSVPVTGADCAGVERAVEGLDQFYGGGGDLFESSD
jgi:hypothetical protein